MEFRIADTFIQSLTRLTGAEQKAVKLAAFDLQMNPARPGFSFHRLDRARDKRFWSVRVNDDIRIIVHRTGSSLLLCYAGHHDDAYRWAERRRLETHPRTGAAQLVEVRETTEVAAAAVHAYAAVPRSAPRVHEKPPLFAEVPEEELLGYGVPPDWIQEVRTANEDTLLDLVDHLPAEAAEALLELATGGTPASSPVARPDADPFEHPDAQRRFRTVQNIEELERALEYPWEKWTVFLHPAQRALVEKEYGGPARISGSAGTGKTVVALHRAAHLARKHPEARVLLTTFSDTLAHLLRIKLHRLIGNEPRVAERIEVHSMEAVGTRLFRLHGGTERVATAQQVRQLVLQAAAARPDHGFPEEFVLREWETVVDAWQLRTWDEYRDIARVGRRRRLSEGHRAALWTVFERVRAELREGGWVTRSEMFSRVAEAIRASGRSPYDFAVVDEAQDVGVAELRFLAALGASRRDGLFFTGDLGQRIFQHPFSWLALGVDIRGRSKTLRVNYRTSHQIRTHADRLLDDQISDLDGNVESRRGTISVFNGPPPIISVAPDEEAEIDRVAKWLARCSADGIGPGEMGVFVRSQAELERAERALQKAGLPYVLLDEHMQLASDAVSVSTMHLAKGLEFRAVAVMACDDEIIPDQDRIEAVADEAELEEVYNTERHLLYVACTRARDRLLVTGVEPGSEFLDDMRGATATGA